MRKTLIIQTQLTISEIFPLDILYRCSKEYSTFLKTIGEPSLPKLIYHSPDVLRNSEQLLAE